MDKGHGREKNKSTEEDSEEFSVLKKKRDLKKELAERNFGGAPNDRDGVEKNKREGRGTKHRFRGGEEPPNGGRNPRIC